MSLDDSLPEGVALHPAARALLGPDSELVRADDIGPLGSDRGYTAVEEFFRWRRENPAATMLACVKWIEVSFGIVYDKRLLRTAVIEKQLIADETGDELFDEKVHTADETLLASALAQFLSEGKLDADARPAVAIALSRQTHPLVLGRTYGDGGAAAMRVRSIQEASRLLAVPLLAVAVAPALATEPSGSRIRSIDIFGPTIRLGDAPLTDPELTVKVILGGAERPGGVLVPPAGTAHRSMVEALFWKLWEADFRLPDFEEIHFTPTASLPHGTFEVEYARRRHGEDFSRAVRIGVDPARFRSICRGDAMAEGIELFGGAIAAFAERYGLDPTPVEAARAALREHGCELEVVLLAQSFDGFALRAYLALRAKGKQEIIAEHRDATGVRRASAPLECEPLRAAKELKLVRGVVQIVPRSRSDGPTLKFRLDDMKRVAYR